MDTPNGIEQINETFGDISPYIGSDGHLDPSWQTERMDRFALPFTLPLDWDRSKTVATILCHKLMVPVFEKVFSEIVAHSLQSKILTYGGCFTYRPQRGSGKLSTHAWGIAIDLNPSTNKQGEVGDMDANVVTLFRSNGFKWGGDWEGKRRDAMHFQFAIGY